VANSVTFYFATATDAGKLSAHDDLTSQSALDHLGFFMNDTWSLGRMTLNGGVRYDRYHGWLPEQIQLPGSLSAWAPQFPDLASRVVAKTFPEQHIYTWNQIAPRIGVTFDLTGDGKTVLKGNYGLYWHNPGVGLGANGNANTTGKSAAYTWTDTNGDKRWQPGEQGASPTSISLEGTVKVDPNITAPYTHEASGWVERQLSETMGLRAGVVYKTEDNLWATYQPGRPISAYTVPFSFTDIGVDGRPGTGDERVLPMLGFPNATAAAFPTDSVVMNLPQFSRFTTYEVSMNKRYGNKWSGQAGYGFTQLHDFANGYPQNPNQPGVTDRTIWNFKAAASYDAAYGIRISPVLRHQSGVNFARTIAVTGPASCACTATSTNYADAADANREDNIWVFDVRAERSFNLTSRMRIRAYFDAFNLANSHASETISRATGLSYLKPSAILAPRTARVGFRFIF
jgi:hypothetical protein